MLKRSTNQNYILSVPYAFLGKTFRQLALTKKLEEENTRSEY